MVFHYHFGDPGAEEEERRIADSVIFGKLLAYLRPWKREVAIVLVALAVAAAASTYIPVTFQRTIDTFVNSTSLPLEQRLSGLSFLVVLAIGLQVTNLVANAVETRVIGALTQAIVRNIRRDMF